MQFDVLTFVDSQRGGTATKVGRFYYDFAINGRSLVEIASPGDFITPFGWLGRELERRYYLQLLKREVSELRSGRVPLYICPQCADLGCGCLTVSVTEYDDCFVWSEFGLENDYDEDLLEVYPDIRDFAFEKTGYQRALNRFGFE